jgi:hypothetical protein
MAHLLSMTKEIKKQPKIEFSVKGNNASVHNTKKKQQSFSQWFVKLKEKCLQQQTLEAKLQ